MKPNKCHSYNLKKLPNGCLSCILGQKVVIFITGICPRKCYFCPVSDHKFGKDDAYANERKINSTEDLFKECELMQAKGAGITGGDPLSRLDRTVEYIQILKEKYGKEFHIHLYTSLNLVTKETLKKLYDAGLDEIRFHFDLDNDKLVVMVQGQDIEKTVRTEKVSWDRERIMIREYKDYIYECEAVSSHNFQVGRDPNNSYQMTSSVFAYVLNNTKSRTNREDLPDRTENEIREVELEPKILSSSPAPGIEIAVSAKASILFPEGLDRTYTSDNEGAIEIDMNIGYPHIISESISDMSLDNVNLSWLPSSQRQRALNYIKTQTQRETVELSLEAQGLEVEGGDYSIGLLVCPEKDVVKEYLGE